MNALSQRAGMLLQPALSPRLQQAVRLLHMSSQEFAQSLADALGSNPFLEQEEPDGTADGAADAHGSPAAQVVQKESWASDRLPRASRPEGEGDVFDTLAAPTSLADHLLGQLAVLRLSARDFTLAAAVVASLEEDGYLRTPLEDVGPAAQLLPAATAQETRIALRRVQALDPCGVAARGVAECLALQVSGIPGVEERALAACILHDHLDALVARDMRGLARRLGRSAAAIEAACAAIRRLDPHPGWRFAEPAVHYVTPDVIARKVRGRWTAVLNEAVLPRVRLNQRYAQLFQRHRGAGDGELGAQLQDARWTVRNIEQRFATILNVAQAIVGRQQQFLAYGAMAMKPLALREIAREVGVHESTVSRVTNNKFVATPCGVFELKYFFSRGLATAGGGECSPTAIRGLIRELIAAETPGRPLSDVELARQLDSQGLKVARRTVTKYRQFLRIEPAERRRHGAAAASAAAFL